MPIRSSVAPATRHAVRARLITCLAAVGRPFPSLARTPLSVAALVVALPLALGAQAAAPVAPAPTGSHAVGRRLLTWVDTSRRDPVDSARARAIVG